MGVDTGQVRQMSEQLHSTGMLVIPESPMHLQGSLLGCIGFTALGVGVILIANRSGSPLLCMLVDIACIGFFDIIGIPDMMRKIILHSRLMVTPEELRLEWCNIVNESVHRLDIAEFFGQEVIPGSGTQVQSVIGYTLTPLGQQMRRQDATTIQLGQQINEVADRGIGREERVYLPGTLEGSKENLLVLLQQAHQFYGAPGGA